MKQRHVEKGFTESERSLYLKNRKLKLEAWSKVYKSAADFLIAIAKSQISVRKLNGDGIVLDVNVNDTNIRTHCKSRE